MIDFAMSHIEELKKVNRNTWYKEEFKFFNSDCYFEDIEIKNDTWSQVQLVSLKNDKVAGYMSVEVKRGSGNHNNLAIINYNQDTLIFGKEVMKFIKDIVTKEDFRKLNFTVIIGNPIEKTYDKIIKKYGGRIVGILNDEVKLFDGKYYSKKIYEITKKNIEVNHE